MRQKNVTTMIVMIIGVFILIIGQLSAEEEVGKSIFTNIETPHPYPAAAAEGKTLVWSKTIDQPGVTWIKIHFSKFRLDQDDYVNLVDMNGRVIEQIKGRDVSRKTHSKFNVKKDVNKSVNSFSGKDAVRKDQSEFKAKKDGDKTFSFWGPAVDGDKVTVELYSTFNTKKNLGFSIDEIGIGCLAILEKDMEPIIKEGEKIDMSIHPFWKKNPRMSLMGYRGNPVDIVSIPKGKMLYRKNTTWYTCEGTLNSKLGTQFFPGDACLDSRDILDTLEVRFYLEYTTKKNVKNIPGYYTYYSDGVVEAESNHFITQINLRNDNQMFSLDRNIGTNSSKDENLAQIYDVATDYNIIDPENNSIYNGWKQQGVYVPTLEVETEQIPTPVARVYLLALDETVNRWYNVTMNINGSGNVEEYSREELTTEPGGITCGSSTGISRTSHCSRCYCCWIQYRICETMKQIFWWRWCYFYCYQWYRNCLYKTNHSCGEFFDIWGIYWVLYHYYHYHWYWYWYW